MTSLRLDIRQPLLNGTEFDNSEGEIALSHLELGATIPGLSEALQLMKPGAKWILYIPPKLAYGRKGLRGKVSYDAGVIYELTLIKVVPKPDNSITDALERVDRGLITTRLRNSLLFKRAIYYYTDRIFIPPKAAGTRFCEMH